MDQLRQAWADSVLVELLGTDLERVMREHLVNQGYLRATSALPWITLDVERRITATITVDPGARTTERRVAFIGNHAIDEKTLLADRHQAAANRVGVARPGAARVVGGIHVRRARLPGREGRCPADRTRRLGRYAAVGDHGRTLSRIATVRDDGTRRSAKRRRLEGHRRRVGQPYVAGSEQAARQALERYYRNLGLPGRQGRRRRQGDTPAKARSISSLSAGRGPAIRRRLGSDTGVESTRDSLVDRATRIEPGVPASPSLAESTRRRLYDIGTFRSANVTFEPVTAAPATDTVPVNAVVSLQESKRFLFLYGFETTNQYQSLFDQRVIDRWRRRRPS